MSLEARIPDWAKPGAAFTLRTRRYHVRGIVDGRVVVRSWWKQKPWWHYNVLDAIFFEFNGPHITRIKKAPKETPNEP